jgi:hypothetical protein
MLIKVRTKDVDLITRALYGEDLEFLSTIDKNSNLALDSAVEDVVSNSSKSFFFKVLHVDGALIGFFMVPMVNVNKNTQFFFVRKTARIPEYYKEFYKLVSETIYGQITQSLTKFNIENINVILKDKFVIPGPYMKYGTKIN